MGGIISTYFHTARPPEKSGGVAGETLYDSQMLLFEKNDISKSAVII